VVDAEAQVGREAKTATGRMDAMGRSMRETTGYAKSLAAAGAAAVAALAGPQFMHTLAEYDRLNASLKTVTGSLQTTGAASVMLRKFAAETPYELTEVTEAFIRLKALGLDASERSLRSYGNTASASSKSMIQYVEAVADATTGEFERLKEFGIKASKQGEQITFTFRNVRTTVANDAAAQTQFDCAGPGRPG
jgi:hypothetical protein